MRIILGIFGCVLVLYLGHTIMLHEYKQSQAIKVLESKTLGMHEQAIAPPDPVFLKDTSAEYQAEVATAWEEARRLHEENEKKWLAKNPPVKKLFDADQGYDTAYVIQYLKENPIAGDCALVSIPDVVCTDFGERVVFPTSRK